MLQVMTNLICRRYFGWLVLFMATMLVGCSNDPRIIVQDLLSEGDQLLASNNYVRAIETWNRALSIDPQQTILYKSIGMAYVRMHNLASAEKFLRHYLQDDPGDIGALSEVIRIKLIKNDLAAAQQMLTKLDTAKRNTPRMILLQGDLFMLKKEYLEAEACYASVLQQKEKSVAAKIKLSICLYAQGEHEKANRIIRNIEIENLDDAALLRQLGDYYKLNRELSKAEASYLAAARHAPRDIDHKMDLALFYADTSEQARAIPYLLAILDSDPSNSSVKKLLVQVYLSSGQIEDATMLLNEIFAPDSEDFELHLLKGRYHLQVDEPVIAATYFEYVLQKETDSPAAHYWVGIALLNSGQNQLAKKHLIEALALNNDFVDAEIAIAALYYRMKEYDMSIEHLKRVIDKEPENTRAYKILGGAFLAQERAAEAAAAFETARAINPSDSTVLYFIGRAYEQAGDTNKAKEIYRKLLSQRFLIDASLRYAKILFDEGRSAEAVGYFYALQKEKPSNGYILYVISEIYYAMGNMEEAMQFYERCLKLNPEIVPAYIKLATIYLQRNEHDQASELLKRCSLANEGSATPQLIDASICYSDGLLDETINILLSGYRRFNDNDVMQNNLAYSYLEKNIELTKAFAFAQTAYQICPNEPSNADTLGWAYYKKGMYQMALWYLDDALSKLNSNGTVNESYLASTKFHIGSVLFSMQKYQKAAQYLSEALSAGLKNADNEKALSLLKSINVDHSNAAVPESPTMQ